MAGLLIWNNSASIQNFPTMMEVFASELREGSDVGFSTTASSYFHSTGTSTGSFGPTTMSVTSYTANSLPETISECGGSVTVNALSIDIGAVPSSNLKILTYENFSGTIQDETTDITISLISLTQA